MAKVTIQQALRKAAKEPTPPTADMLEQPVHALVAEALFTIANNPDARVRGSMRRATRAQRIILNRMVGRRRTGSHPATKVDTGLVFTDLTAGAIDE